MNKLFHFFLPALFTFYTVTAFAQAPQKFNYQGVARDNSGNVLASQNIGVRITLHSGSPGGAAVYSETHTETTNQFGLFNIEIGGGTVVSGNITAISWGSNTYYVQVEMDASGGTSYQDMGTSQLLSVPYALYAENSGTGWSKTGNIGTVDGTNFIGTTDDVPFNIRVNNQKAGHIESTNANSFYGYKSGNSNTAGIYNTANGYQSLMSNTASYSVAIGANALHSNTTGNQNTAVGVSSLFGNTTGTQNVAMGPSTLSDNTTGSANTAFGNFSLFTNVAGNRATAIGAGAMYNANNSSTSFINYNVAVGFEALYGSLDASANTGNANTVVGYQAMNANTTGGYNIAIGTQALYANTTGFESVAIGPNSLLSNTTGYQNTATGINTLANNTTGNGNAAFGNFALTNNVAGNGATAVGFGAMRYSSNSATPFTNYNVAVGYEALLGSSTPANNTGNGNTVTGYQALWSNSSGSSNTITGYLSGYSNTTGQANSFFGWRTGYSSVSANDNAIFGYDAGYNTTAGENAFFGSYAGNSVTTGTRNTYIGRQADGGTATLTNSTALGFGASVSASNKVRLGNSSVSVVEGQVAYTFPSDARFKENVKEDIRGLDFILRLHPVSYNFNRLAFAKHINENTEGREQELLELSQMRSVGFLAQDIEKLIKETNFDAFDAVHTPESETDNYSLSYSHFVIPLVKAVQELSLQNEELKRQNAQVMQEIEAIKKMIE